MGKKIRVGAVSYLNTKPLLYGIKRSALINTIELVEEYPSRIAAMLMNDEIDVGLVPVAIMPGLAEAHIITDYCIGADGEVASVALFSEVPMNQVTKVYLDHQSRTSLNLAHILLKYHWQNGVELIYTENDPRSGIKGTAAAVVIGDRALEQRKISPFTYDLAAAWKAYTGLPFVFAAWISNKKLPDAFINDFNMANAFGLEHLPEVIAENPYPVYDLDTYYTKNISFHWTAEKRQGLELFLQKMSGLSHTY